MSMRFWSILLCAALASGQAFATDVKEVVSPGGIKAWLVEEHTLPLIAVNVAFSGSGSAYDPKGKSGRANSVAAMLTEGAGDLDSRAFNEALENRAIQLNTSVDEDLLYASVESLAEYKQDAFNYLGMVLTKPRFDGEALDRTRRQTLTLIKQQEEDPKYRTFRAWQEMAFGAHPYGKPPLGTASDVEDLSKSDLRDYVTNYLTKENAIIAVVGDITPEELGTLLDNSLKDLPASYKPDTTVEEVQLAAGDKPAVLDFDIPQTMVMFGTGGVKRNDPDYFPAYVMSHILGGGGSLTARLGQEIREKRGLSYSVYAYIDPLTHAAAWRGQFATRNEQAANAVDVLRTTIRDFVEQGPTEKELTDAKQYLTGSFVLSLDSNAEVARFLINMQLNNLGKDYLDRRNDMVEAVTRDQVMAMSKRLLDADKLLIVMVGKPQLSTPPAQ